MVLTGFSISDILASEYSPEKLKDDVKFEQRYADSVLSHYSSLYRCTCDAQQMTSPPSSKCNTSTGSVTSSPDGESSGSDDDKITRRPRTSITMCQRDHLEREFQKERYPTLAYIDKLSHQVHLPQYVIKVWFQNRRAKYRKEGHRRNKQKLTVIAQHSSDMKTNIDLSRVSSLPWNYNETTKFSSLYRADSPAYSSPHYPTISRSSSPYYPNITPRSISPTYTSDHSTSKNQSPPLFTWQCNRINTSPRNGHTTHSESTCNCQKCLQNGDCFVKY